MTTSRIRRAGLALVLAVGVLSGGFATLPATSAQAAVAYDPITGSGSTWSQNALDQWRKNVAANYGMTVNFSGTGSSAGRRDFIQNTVDFAISEIPFQSAPEDGSAPETPTTKFTYMPIVAGGTAFMYNLKINGQQVTNLRLSGEVITKIFTGGITKWNDPAIVTDNPGLTMPDRQITPVVRSDGSGSTAQFTLWMSKQYSSLWNDFCASVGRNTPCGLTSQYPTFGNAKAQNGSLGVSGYVKQNYGEGAITYVEYSYALNAGFPVAKVLNNKGYYIEPTDKSVAVALTNATINSDLTQVLDNVYNSSDARAYPLSSYSYAIVPTEVKTGGVFTTSKGSTLSTFLRYVLCDGQKLAGQLGYSPLPMNLVLAGSEQIKRIPGSGGTGVDINACSNPTFKAGDSPSNNQLALTAPQPAACDAKGLTQCETGTAGARAKPTVTKNTGSTSTSTSSSGTSSSAASSGTSGTSGAASTSGTGAVAYDESGNVVSSGATTAGGAVSSRPYTLADSAFGLPQWLMVGAGVLLLLLIAVPPLASAHLRRGSRR